MCHTALNHDRRWAVFSPEMGEWEEFCSKLIAWLAGDPFYKLPDQIVADWAEWCRSRYAFISRDTGDDAPNLDWLIETFTASVLRDGVTDVLLDPWNQIAHNREGMSETDYIDMALRRLSAFGRRHGANVWIIAHPTKLRPARPGDPLPVPTAYDIAGSAGWYAKSDIVLCVYRVDGETQVHCQKAKFDRWAPSGTGDATNQVMAVIEYDKFSGRFSSPGGVGDPTPDDGAAQF
jgi:twinkle protein